MQWCILIHSSVYLQLITFKQTVPLYSKTEMIVVNFTFYCSFYLANWAYLFIPADVLHNSGEAEFWKMSLSMANFGKQQLLLLNLLMSSELGCLMHETLPNSLITLVRGYIIFVKYLTSYESCMQLQRIKVGKILSNTYSSGRALNFIAISNY